MPFVEDTPRDFNILDKPKAEPAEPGLWNTFEAGFRMENPAVNAADLMSQPAFQPQEGFRVGKALRDFDAQNGSNIFEAYRDNFLGVQSEEEMTYVINRIRQQEEDRDTLSRAGWLGVVAGITGGLVSPEIFIPFVGEARGLKAVATGAAIGLASGIPAETILGANQETRTGEDIAMSLAASTALGGILGGASGLLRPGERELFEEEITRVAKPSGAGADVVQLPDPGGLASGAKRVAALNDKTYVLTNPVTQTINQEEFPTWRVLMQQASDSGLAMEKNLEDVATSLGGTIENRITTYLGPLGETVEKSDDLYSRYFFDNDMPSFAPNLRAQLGGTFNANGKLSRAQFEDEVSRAIWNGFEHDVPEVVAAAKEFSAKVFEPILKEAQGVGIIDPDAKVVGDRAYAPRDYNREAIQTRTGEFVEKLAQNYEKQLNGRFEEALKGFQEKLGKQKELADDLGKPVDQVEAEVTKFRDELKAIDETLPEDIQQLEAAIARNRATASAMKNNTDSISNEAARKQLLKDAREMEKEAGAGYKAIKAQRSFLRRRIRNLNQAVVAVDAKRAAKLDRIAKIEDLNLDALSRLVRKAQTTLKQLDRWSDEKLDAEVSALKDQFESTARIYDKGEERLVKLSEDDPQVRRLGALEREEPSVERPAPQNFETPDDQLVLDDSTARAAARPRHVWRSETNLADLNERLVEHRKEFPEYLEKKLQAAIKEPDVASHWEALSEAAESWRRNGKPSKEATALLDDIDEAFNSPAAQSMFESDVKFYKDSFAGAVKAYRKEDLRVLEDWQKAAKEAAKPNADEFTKQWARDPADLAAINKVIGEKRRAETANLNTNKATTEGNHKLGAAEDLQQRRAERLDDIAARLDQAESLDRESIREAIQYGLDKTLLKIDDISRRRVLRRQRLQQEVAALDPKIARERLASAQNAVPTMVGDFARKWEALGAEGVDPAKGIADFKEVARRSAEEVKDTIVGTYQRLPYSEILAKERGSELVRVLDIPSTEIDDFLEKNIKKLASTYVRTLSSDIEIARKYGSLDWRQIIQPAVEELNNKIKVISEAVDKEGKPRPQEWKDKKTRNLNKQFTQLSNNFEAVMQRLRGTRGLPSDPDGFAYRAARTIMNLNVLRMMGMVTVSSLPDLGRPIMRYGLTRTFRDGFGPLVSNLATFKMNAREAKLAGAAMEHVLHTRALAVRDITDTLQRGTKFEKAIDYATNRMGIVALFDYWTQAGKLLTSSITNAKLMESLAKTATGEGDISAKEATNFLAQNGINGDVAVRIWDEVAQGGGGKVNGVWWPNTESWKDGELVRTYRAALAREINNTIITPGVEKPLIADANMLGRMLYQFKSFGMSSTPKMLMAGLQQRDAAVLSGSMASLALGALSYYLWAVATGGKAYEEMAKGNLDKWADEAISRAGLLAGASEVQRIAQNIPLIADYASFSGTRQTRRPGDNLVEALLGPSFDFAQNSLGTIAQLHEPTQGTLRQFVRLLPYQNALGLREAIEAVEAAAGAYLPERRN